MNYLKIPERSSMSLKLKNDIYKNYSGERAFTYDKDRKTGFIRKLKWKREFIVLSKILNKLEVGSSILDAPCGTGRFFPLMEDRFNLYGIDISIDMIQNIPQSIMKNNFNLCIGKIGQLPFSENSFDYILCMRFINIIPYDELFTMISDLCRLAKKGIILQIRFSDHFFNNILNYYHIFNNLIKNRGKYYQIDNNRKLSKSYPRLDQFESFIENLGFRIVYSFPVFCQIDSQRLCLLERKNLKQYNNWK